MRRQRAGRTMRTVESQLQRDSPLLGYSEEGTLDAVFEEGFCTREPRLLLDFICN